MENKPHIFPAFSKFIVWTKFYISFFGIGLNILLYFAAIYKVYGTSVSFSLFKMCINYDNIYFQDEIFHSLCYFLVYLCARGM